MSIMVLSGDIRAGRVRYSFAGALRAGWQAILQHRRDRRELVALSRLPPRIIRDLGLDPERVYEPLDGSWDEVEPAGYRSHLPRKSRI